MLSLLISILFVAGIFFLFIQRASAAVWSITVVLFSLLFIRLGVISVFTEILLTCLSIVLIGFSIKSLRTKILSSYLMRQMQKSLPSMSSTEREALEAGTVSYEADLFSGKPDFEKILNLSPKKLSAEEQTFLDGPVKELCRMIDDWEITHNYTDLPPQIWDFIKKSGFLGMIIPKIYGGLEFSASAQIRILSTIYGRSISCATTISVPNSLGPAELLLKYGTEEQKDYYLPRLANGEDIPCFALTGPNAGSDAASIQDRGVICRQEISGNSVLGIRLNWDKRYITLCPVATIIGLAFRLYDPDNLLGKGTDLGISCALIPASTPGVIKGRRHFPLNTGFLNGPTQGKNVFVPIDSLIGGAKMAGCGWRMLMECLSAGRALSLPSSALGGAQAAALATGAYARVRKQFKQALAKFEGIEAPLARIAANTYIIDAGLTMAAAVIDEGAKPSVLGAILKYHTTERARQVALDAMDIHGGKGICLGPNNYLGRGYQNAPISITVEGANILTRSLIIFGQGAIRCHPYVYTEMQSIASSNLKAFDEAFWGHANFFMSNYMQSFLFAFTNGRGLKVPGPSVLKPYYQQLQRYSTNFAFLADFAMLILGGSLKRRELLSARLGDILSNLYLALAVLKRFHDDGEHEEDLPLVHWCCQLLFFESEQAFKGIIDNFPSWWARKFISLTLLPFGARRLAPSDLLAQKLAKILTTPSDSRQRLARFVFTEPLENCPIGRLEQAFKKICAVEDLDLKLGQFLKATKLKDLTTFEQIKEALKMGMLTEKEASKLQSAEEARQEVIAVDDFSDDELRRQVLSSSDKLHEEKKVESNLHPA